jgi:integrase
MAIVRQAGTYHFRRRIPDRLRPLFGKNEFWRSLNTCHRQEALAIAGLLDFRLQGTFDMLTEIEQHIEKQQAAVQRLIDTDADKGHIAAQTAILQDLIARYRTQVESSQKNYTTLALEVDMLRTLMSQAEAATQNRAQIKSLGDTAVSSAKAGLDAAKHLNIRLKENKSFQDRLLQTLARNDAPAPQSQSPLFSTLIDDFIAEKSRTTEDHRGYSEGEAGQARMSLRLFLELLGDKPVRDYTGADAGKFRSLLLQLPSSHGKSSKNRVDALTAIKQASEDADTLSMKTVKKHFSRLSQYWKFLRPRGHVDKIIFEGFEFKGTKSSKTKRDMWSDDDLKKLFSAKIFRADAHQSADWWLPRIAAYSGMRLEEICRLRPQDIVTVDGVTSFQIQEHSESSPGGFWSPKTEAGARLVPIHSILIAHGFMNLFTKSKNNDFILDLVPGGPDRKRGYRFSKNFSNRKTAAGVGEKTVFHSFRHNTRTQAESVDIHERWIDAVFGHEDPDRSEGGKTYAKTVDITRLQQVIEAIDYDQKIGIW